MHFSVLAFSFAPNNNVTTPYYIIYISASNINNKHKNTCKLKYFKK